MGAPIPDVAAENEEVLAAIKEARQDHSKTDSSIRPLEREVLSFATTSNDAG